MQTNTLKAATKRITSPRVGRGGKRGKTSGRGTKGQKARAGRKMRPEMRDLIKKLPKRRGHGQNRSRTVRPQVIYTQVIYTPINLASLEAAFSTGDRVSPLTLREKKLVGSRGGYILPVKILGTGTLSKKLEVVDCFASASARAAIEKAGGSISHA
jgi:large subunit ribosomal protein L15